jgi:primosomal protein N' (replication factor Y)
MLAFRLAKTSPTSPAEALTIPSPEHPVAAVLPLVPAWRVDKTFDYLVPAKLAARVAPGTLVRIPFGGRVVRGFVLALEARETDGELETVTGVVIDVPLATPAMAAVLGDVARRYVTPRGRVFGRLVPPRVRVVAEPVSEARRDLAPDRLSAYEGGPRLAAAIRSRATGAWCLQALPGEDRGRVIAELVAAVPSGAALVLVPEVRYGSVVLDGLATHQPALVRVDSGQDDPARSRAWLQMAKGHVLAGGGRAAVLTPAPDLALIVVDEEHHQTYKEDRAPRYDARRVALDRAARQDAICVYISASPSVETGEAASVGRFGSVHPNRSARRRARPVVELVDRPEDRSIGTELHERIGNALRDGHRTALLAPSPAFARAVWCGQCRRSLRCPRCEAGLFFDRGARRVRCARCGHTEPAPDTCPSCGADDFKLVGAGTERLAGQLAKAFPRARVHRVDPADPAAAGGAEADIYVTTWMGTKPALRPDVSLVGVLDADWLIRRPDFRSAESAYQAMVEMSEWAGPADDGGRLVIQTAEPNHHSLQAVVRADYDFFLRRELEHRRELSYPPYAEIVKVSAHGDGARTALEMVAAAVADIAIRVLGPVDIAAPGGQSVPQLLIKCRDAGVVADTLRGILTSAAPGVRLAIDVDPR